MPFRFKLGGFLILLLCATLVMLFVAAAGVAVGVGEPLASICLLGGAAFMFVPLMAVAKDLREDKPWK